MSCKPGLRLEKNTRTVGGILLSSMALFSGVVDASGGVASIRLVPLPETPSVELPLTTFQSSQVDTHADPRAIQMAKRIRQLVSTHKATQALGIQGDPFGVLAPVNPQVNQQSAFFSVASGAQLKPKKSLSPQVLSLLSQGGAVSGQANKNMLQTAVETETSLKINMRSIGSPRQIEVADSQAVQNRLSKVPRAVVGQSGQENTVRTFLNHYRDYLRIDNPDNELSLAKTESDHLNRRHFRFKQVYQGLPVWPAEMIVHTDAVGNVDLVDGAFIPTPRDLATQPTITAEDAITVARSYVSGAEQVKSSKPQLIVYGALQSPARLAWKLILDVSIDTQYVVVVDALNALVLTAFNTVSHQNVAGSGKDLLGITRQLNVWQKGNLFYLVDTSKHMYDPASTPPQPNTTKGGIIVTDAKHQELNANLQLSFVTSNNKSSGWLADGVSAAFNFSKVYDYYYLRHGCNSIDGDGGTISAAVRLGTNFSNAFWRSDLNAMYFGDAHAYAAALDVVAHEMTHGVTANTANLTGGNQPGAMNEAFSDIFGSSVEAYANGSTDWIMGGNQFGVTLRNLKNPSSSITGECGAGTPYPAKMSEYLNSPNTQSGDYGGVHCNSSIFSHAYYLLAQGLNGALGIPTAERIFYRALTKHLTSQAEFVDARLACVQSAKELFGANSTQAVKTAQAFDAVEIFDSSPTPAPNPGPSVNAPDSTLFVSYDLSSFGYRLARRETALGDSVYGSWLSQSTVVDSRASVTADGQAAVFVKSNNDLCLVFTNKALSESCLGFPRTVHSVAVSPDAQTLGFVMLDTSGNPENKITVIDVASNKPRVFPLVAPASEGLTVNSVVQADAMTFSSNGRFLLYDALNIIKLADGSTISGWSIYAIDLVTKSTLLVVPPFAGYDIGFPTLGHTTDDFMTFEAKSQSTGQSIILAGNLRTGKVAAVGSINNGYAVPAYTGDDTAITYSVPAFTLSGYSVYKQPLASDHITKAGNPVVWVQDGDAAVIYRRGIYYKVNLKKSGTGQGIVTSNVGTIRCGDSCSSIYPKGTAVKLTAKAYVGAKFVGWSGACTGTAKTCTFTMTQNKAVTATFKAQ